VTEQASQPGLDPEAGTEFAQETPDDGPHEVSLGRWAVETAGLVVAAYVLAYLIRMFVVQPFYIPSGSMEPTLMPGDQVLVNKFIYRFQPPADGDIVVLHAPKIMGRIDLIKRVVGVAGQTVEMRGARLLVDGRIVNEPYVKNEDGSPFGPVTVPAGTVFLMGDNRTNSRDSRFIGAIPLSSLMGKAFVIYWPLTLDPGQSRTL
jgi:signal peptidase I